MDSIQQECKKYFFPKSFVNKQLIDQLNKSIYIFEKRKPGKIEKNKDKMIKSYSSQKFKKNR